MLETLFQMIAPDHCVNCNALGTLLCEACAETSIKRAHSTCYRCNRLSDVFRTCDSCRSSSPIYAAYKLSLYEGAVKDLVHATKFQEQRSGAERLGQILAGNLPDYAFDSICYVPTDSRRVRQRGFDHAQDIALHVAINTGRPLLSPLLRTTHARQVGVGREQRMKQMKGAFIVGNSSAVRARSVLLVDDVLSTGASIEAAARQLKLAGAKRVTAAVLAHNR